MSGTDITGRMFYASTLGDRLVDEVLYPSRVREYLAGERRLLEHAAADAQVLVEVGCMEGRHLRWAMDRGMRYVGIDVVPRYLEAARALAAALRGTAEIAFVLGGAEQLPVLLAREGIMPGRDDVLLYFPFNSFGNMDDPLPVIGAILATRAPFLICSYLCTEGASDARAEYYAACEYRDLLKTETPEAVRFTSEEGLSTAAYRPEYLVRAFAERGLEVRFEAFSEIGAAYSYRTGET